MIRVSPDIYAVIWEAVLLADVIVAYVLLSKVNRRP